MGRPKSNATALRSMVVYVQLREEEWAGLKQFAADLDQVPSRILRRLIRTGQTAALLNCLPLGDPTAWFISAAVWVG